VDANSEIEQLAIRRKLWIECLSGQDVNSIQAQLIELVLNVTAYRTVIEARRYAPAAPSGGLKISGLLHTLLDRCFWESQVMGVRRLMDTYPLEKTGRMDRSVFSLLALIGDIEKHAHLLTRENIFGAEQLSYDEVAAKKKEIEYCVEHSSGDQEAFFIPEEFSSSRISERHRQIDDLVGVSADRRHPQDKVPPEVLVALGNRIKCACNSIVEYANKYYAHPATPSSRDSSIFDERNVTLKHLLEAHESLCRTAQFICLHLVGPMQYATFLPVLPTDPLRYIHEPLLLEENVTNLRSFWSEQEKNMMSWQAWSVAEIKLSQPDK